MFLCPQQRIKAMGKIFITVGFVPTNIKIPPLCHNILLEKSAFELRKGLDEFKELLISQHFGKVPDGRNFKETEALHTESEPLLKDFCDSITVSGEDLRAFDFVEITKPKNVSVKDPLSQHHHMCETSPTRFPTSVALCPNSKSKFQRCLPTRTKIKLIPQS